MPGNIFIPKALHSDPNLNAQARYAYILIVHTRPPSITELAKSMFMSRGHAANLCKMLQQHGWVKLQKTARETAVLPLLPDAAQHELVELLKQTRPYAPFLGEFIMKR